LYGALMAAREQAYVRGWLRSWRPSVPTVSVGNIGWGGSGKTPLSGWLLHWAGARGIPAALLTRGYRARPERYPYLVAPDALAEEAGDEPLLLARANPGARVLVDPVRRRAGALAVERFRARLLVLDDGFQHLAVQRDLNLCLLTPHDVGPGWGRVCPAGTWREAAAALGRADAFLVKCGNRRFKDLADRLRARLGGFRRPIFSMQLRPVGVRNLVSGEARRDFEGLPYLLATGVADPGQVATTAARLLGNGPAAQVGYPDHHLFTRRDVAALESRARDLGCRFILCTAKDAVKLGPMATPAFHCLETVVGFGPTLGAPRPFPLWWADRFAELNAGAPAASRTADMDQDMDLAEPDAASELDDPNFEPLPSPLAEPDSGPEPRDDRDKEPHGQKTETT
ncbi:MAG: tetraacyldisaccharide 4'-kinase, partial [Desulfovibrionaceae bacterium]